MLRFYWGLVRSFGVYNIDDVMDSNLAIALFGYRSDHFGSRKLPFTLGLVSLCSSTILFAVARTPAVLVISRAFQGLSCAAVWVVGLVLLVENIPQERIGQAMGYTTVNMTMGGLLGPMLGEYRMTFWGTMVSLFSPRC